MYIHQSDSWPHFTWANAKVTEKLLAVNKADGYLSGRLSVIGFDAKQKALVETITHDIVASSEIEGVLLNTDQVRSSVARKLGVTITNETDSSRYIDGIVEMMMDATSNFKAPLTDDRLFGWHNCLFPNGRSGIIAIDVAKYRSAEMKVVSGMFGREKVHYEAPPSSAVPEEMNRFIDWFNTENRTDPVLKAAIAHLWFVAIHPFDDGNGRLTRTLTDMLLSRADGMPHRFYSISAEILLNRNEYYAALENTTTKDVDITLWLEWFLRSVRSAML